MTSRKTADFLWMGLRVAAIPALCVALTACGTTKVATSKKPRSKEYFAESIYGVKASPRVVEEGKHVPKGGGRAQVGKPYLVKGKWYTPKEDFGYNKTGMSSWYGSAFHGRLTANGEVYDKYHLSAAHPTFPLPSYARVTNMENGTSVVVRVNDRGPYEYGRIIDVSSKTADFLDMKRKGSAQVRVQYIGRAPLEGNDMPYLMASYVKKGDRGPASFPEGQIASGVMVASNEPLSRQVEPRQAGSRQAGNLGQLTIPSKASLGASAPLTALAEPAAVPFGAASAMDAMVLLPEIGPVPRERPDYSPSVAYAAAYVEARVSDKPTAFDAILVDRNPLTPNAIKAYAGRRDSRP